MDIEIKFINKSNDMNNSHVVIFQKNVATDFNSAVIAWKVIKNCGRDWTHKFTYPMTFEVAAADSYGNVSNLKSAENGQKWAVVHSNAGDLLELQQEPSASPIEVEVKNQLSTSSIDAQIYKSGSLLASKEGVAPGEKGVFQFVPEIYVGVSSQVEEGEEINQAIIEDFNQKFSLFGLTKADLIMTGGGIGVSATPFVFELVPTA